jgi:uncharacterized protein
VETGLARHLNGIDEATLRQGGEISGRLFESFVVLDLFKHAFWSDEPVGLYHFRSRTGQEVDLVMEGRGGRVVEVEIS